MPKGIEIFRKGTKLMWDCFGGGIRPLVGHWKIMERRRRPRSGRREKERHARGRYVGT